MDYRKDHGTILLRVDKGEEVIETILNLCEKENISSCTFQGIGGCGEAVLQTYIAEKEEFTDHVLSGMLELVSLNGNITVDMDGTLFCHSHGLFSYLDEQGNPAMTAGHLKMAVISYTGEIQIFPTEQPIGRMFDSKSGITVWKL